MLGKARLQCHCCSGPAKKCGFYRNKNFTVQRFQCHRCGKSFSERQPLDGLRVDFKTACMVVRMLTEGCGIRAISRLTGLHKQTVLNVLEISGQKCLTLLKDKVRGIQADHIEIDEVWSFVFCKQQNTSVDDLWRGDQYAFLAVDATTKLILAFHIGKRDRGNAATFIANIREVVSGSFQLSSDGFRGYGGFGGTVRETFGSSIDYATEIKSFGKELQGPRRYSPMHCISVRKTPEIGNPDLKITTVNHAERNNLSVRLFNRRYTRLTLGYSKKLENHWCSTALHVAHFNFCRPHSAHKQTPAVAAGLTDHTWSIPELLQEP